MLSIDDSKQRLRNFKLSTSAILWFVSEDKISRISNHNDLTGWDQRTCYLPPLNSQKHCRVKLIKNISFDANREGLGGFNTLWKAVPFESY